MQTAPIPKVSQPDVYFFCCKCFTVRVSEFHSVHLSLLVCSGKFMIILYPIYVAEYYVFTLMDDCLLTGISVHRCVMKAKITINHNYLVGRLSQQSDTPSPTLSMVPINGGRVPASRMGVSSTGSPSH